ncbi:DivIVA domain-containing protein [Amycolatopsis lexingtonensis]|uniref:Cell wall synthesis protein Wag31 n=1 Tax=Amycolatopsis lexingtonensis TaxID=218822 RepID=A0ABR9HY10_9PSEU|nr:DivIVA domain-containing protein [Amycolatopsis lexingtonensis]MBE1495810.1 DivIVA domain-containing protein [Amycolatopsis lexingtonensis]
MTLPLPTSFALTLRGYDREQVDEHLAEIRDELRLLTLDRDAAVAEAETLARRLEAARTEIDRLRVRLDRLAAAPADPAAVGDRVRHMLELARAEADAVVTTARRRADAIVRQANAVEQRAAARLRAIDDYLARAEHLLAEEAEPAVRSKHLTAA